MNTNTNTPAIDYLLSREGCAPDSDLGWADDSQILTAYEIATGLEGGAANCRRWVLRREMLRRGLGMGE